MSNSAREKTILLSFSVDDKRFKNLINARKKLSEASCVVQWSNNYEKLG